MEQRLQKILSQAGVASRRAAERLIAEGRVTLNGKTVHEMGTKADAGADDIRVDGRRLASPERKRYILLYKPAGYVSTRSDPQRRRTVIDLLGGVREYVYPVGRLDYDTEGLLLLTNDGDLADQVMRPGSCTKTYHAKVRGVPEPATLQRLSAGVVLDGRRTRPCRVRRLRAREHAWLEIELSEGRRNQIRRMFERAGHPVSKLRRVAIGPLSDPGLPPGAYRRLTQDEIDSLKETVA